jgi:RNA polymerase sigma-70 factor, ECF subfamily
LDVLLFWILLESLDEVEQDFVKNIYTEYGKTVYAIAYDIVGNKDDAGDVLSQVMIKVIKNLTNFTGKSRKEIRSLIVIYSRNTVIDIYRQNKRRMNKEDNEEPDIKDYDTDIEKLILSDETAKIIAEALLKLDPEYKDIILLKYVHGYKSSKIAELFNITEDNVNTKLHRAKKQLLEIAGCELHDRLYI